MDKDKIIDEILAEWAMRSPDGLVGGHDTPENVSTLQSLLLEYLESSQVDEVMSGMFGEAASSAEEDEEGEDGKNNKQKKAEDTPDFIDLFKKRNPSTNKYDMLVTADDKPFKGKAMRPIPYYMKWTKNNVKLAFELSEKDPFWKRLKPEKNIDVDRKEGIKRAFAEMEEKNKALVKRFKALYDSIPITTEGVKQAIAIYEGSDYKGISYSEYLPLVNKVDAYSKTTGTGRGELVFLFLLKGMKSGGIRDVDLVYAEKDTKVKREKGIEVKEIMASSLIAISAPTFEGFYKSNFNVAVHELALAASKYENLSDFLERTMKKQGTNQNAINAVMKFFEEPKVGEISQTFLDGIFSVYAAFKTGTSPEQNVSDATVDIDIGNVEKEFKILNPQTILPQVQKVDSTQGSATLDMQVAYTKEKGDEYLRHALMKLKFFRKEWTIDIIHDEMMKLLLTNYSKMLVVDKRSGSNQAELYEEPQMRKLRFESLGFGKVNFKAPPSLK
jgi:hypothetical protein